MKILPESVAGGGDFTLAGAARFDFSTVYRYWSGWGDLELAGEGAFTGIGAMALIVPIRSALGSAATGVQITLSGLEPAVAAAITGEPYRDRPARLWRVQFDAAGTTLLGFQPFYAGAVGPIEEIETVGGTVDLVIPIEGNALDLNRAGGRMRSGADQATLGGPNDRSLKRVAFAGEIQLSWGAAPAQPAAQAIPAVGGFGGPFGPLF